MKPLILAIALVLATGATRAEACKLSREPEPWPKITRDGGIELPFETLGKRIVVFHERANCSVRGPNRLKVHTWKKHRSYDIDCAIESPRYESTTTVRLVEGFKAGKEYLRRKRRWGIELTKSDDREGSTITTALCPAESDACVEIVHGGIEFLRFDVRPLH